MTRQTRIVLVIGAIAILAVVLLGVVARQYSRFASPTRSVADVATAGEGDDAANGSATGDAEASESSFRAFVAGREAVRAFAEDHPDMAESIVKEAAGEASGEGQVKMFAVKLVELRVRRAKAIEAAGLDETSYVAIREQFRLWQRRDPTADGSWVATFESDPDSVARAELGDLEPLDF